MLRHAYLHVIFPVDSSTPPCGLEMGKILLSPRLWSRMATTFCDLRKAKVITSYRAKKFLPGKLTNGGHVTEGSAWAETENLSGLDVKKGRGRKKRNQFCFFDT